MLIETDFTYYFNSIHQNYEPSITDKIENNSLIEPISHALDSLNIFFYYPYSNLMNAFVDKVICFENENNIYLMPVCFKYCFRLILQVLCFVFVFCCCLLIVEEK